MNFLSSHGTNLIIVHGIMHLGTDSCYSNDYLSYCYQHVIIMMIMIIINNITTITCIARKGINANIL